MANYANLPAPTPEGGLNRYMQEIRKFPLLEPEEEYMLAKRWVEEQDTEAAHRMVTSHLRLAAKIAMGYRGYGLPQAEVISEANVGLMQAVKRFDPEKGFRLATYAMWWIRASIQEYILRSWSLVKLGTTSGQKKLFFNLRKAKNRIGALEEGDLHPDNVKRIATDLGVTAPVILGQDEGEGEEPPGTEAMTEVMKLAKERFNKGITQPRNSVMLEVLGAPRESKTVDCSGVTQPRLKAQLETRQVGPIRVTMLKPALESLERIMAKLQATEPDIYEALGTAGALCARLIRGSRSSWSNHSWGTAIDVKLQGRLDGFGDGGTQFGLLLLAELFNEEGWYWGATYNREDSMHFEVGVETLKKWQAEGQL